MLPAAAVVVEPAVAREVQREAQLAVDEAALEREAEEGRRVLGAAQRQA